MDQLSWHPFTQEKTALSPLKIDKACGSYLYTADGQKVFDGISSWWVNLYGHRKEELREAFNKQYDKIDQICFAGLNHDAADDLSKELVTRLPFFNKVFYSDDGSTSVEVAIKMCIQYFHNQGVQKTKIVSFKGSYHGDTFGALSVGDRDNFSNPFESLLFPCEFIDPPSDSSIEESLNQLEKILANGDVAAFIFEPIVQGTNGMKIHSQEGLEKLMELCKAYNVLTIADEVMTGFGRVGDDFISLELSVKPDVMCLAKGITGGILPLGVTLTHNEIYEKFYDNDWKKAFFHGHSYTANSLTCAISLAAFKLLDQYAPSRKMIAKAHRKFIPELEEFSNCLQDVRTRGTLLALEFRDQGGYFSTMRDQIYQFFLERNIFIRPLGNILYILPPYCTNTEDLNYCYKTMREFLWQIKKNSKNFSNTL